MDKVSKMETNEIECVMETDKFINVEVGLVLYVEKLSSYHILYHF